MQIKNTHQQVHEHPGEGGGMNNYQNDYAIDDEVEFELTEEELEELEDRIRKGESGESKTYTWEQAKDHILYKNKLP
jgi:hypothetical protein